MGVAAPVPEFQFAAAGKRLSPRTSFEFRHYRHVSAPTSPAAGAAIYAALRGSRQSSVPFDWEETPGTPKSQFDDEKDDGFEFDDEKHDEFDFDFDFAFGFSDRHHVKTVLQEEAATADELFESGMIRPLKLPPRLYTPVMGDQSPKSARSGGRKSRGKRPGKELDPFAVAMVEVTRSRRGSRSLSPFRGRNELCTPKSSSPATHLPPSMKGRRGWRSWIKELFLFRSSSEGKAAVEEKKDEFCKYPSSSSSSLSSSSSSSSSSILPATVKTEVGGGCPGEESRCSSFRSSDGASSWKGAVMPTDLESMEKKEGLEGKKMMTQYKQSKFSIRSLTGGKFGGNPNRRVS